MKRLLTVLAVVAIAAVAVVIFAFRNGDSNRESVTMSSAEARVEVFYFHLTRRCVTCQAVENVAREAVSELYPSEIEKGKIIFKSLNIEDKTSEADAKRANATGQCLLVISGDKRFDLTAEGFMYARNDPGKLKDEIKKVVDPLLTALEKE